MAGKSSRGETVLLIISIWLSAQTAQPPPRRCSYANGAWQTLFAWRTMMQSSPVLAPARPCQHECLRWTSPEWEKCSRPRGPCREVASLEHPRLVWYAAKSNVQVCWVAWAAGGVRRVPATKEALDARYRPEVSSHRQAASQPRAGLRRTPNKDSLEF